MKRFAAVVLFCLILGLNSPVRAQTSIIATGPTYLASAYGMKCDGSDDTTAFNTLLALVNNPNGSGVNTGGGTIQLPVTQKYCVIRGQITWPANVNIEGCGPVVSDTGPYVGVPGCGLDLQYTGPSNGGYKVLMYDRAQSYWTNLAIKTSVSTDCNPFFFIGGTVAHFDNVSITGSKSNLSACNDVFTLGADISSGKCPGGRDYNDCFYGYFSSFHHIYVAQVRRIGLFGGAANDTDWDYIGINATTGCSLGGLAADCSAFEFKTSNSDCSPLTGTSMYGNKISHIAGEQGTGAANNYLYLVDFQNCANTNSIDWVNASDSITGVTAVVHFTNTTTYSNWVVCGQLASSPACVKDDTGTGNYNNQWLDTQKLALSVRSLNAVFIGNPTIPVNNVDLAGPGSYFTIQGGALSSHHTITLQDAGTNANLIPVAPSITGTVTVTTSMVLLGMLQTLLASTAPSGLYSVTATLNQASTGSLCAPPGAVQATWGFVDLDSNVMYSVGSGGWTSPVATGDGNVSNSLTLHTSLGRLTSGGGVPQFIRFKTGTALTAQVYQSTSASCGTYPTVQYTFTVQGPF